MPIGLKTALSIEEAASCPCNSRVSLGFSNGIDSGPVDIGCGNRVQKMTVPSMVDTFLLS